MMSISYHNQVLKQRLVWSTQRLQLYPVSAQILVRSQTEWPAMANLDQIRVNLTASKGRIADADFAAETANLAKGQILQQAATAMLAQANASKQQVLTLIR